MHRSAHRAGHPLAQVTGQKAGPAVIQAAAQPGGVGLGLLEGFLLFLIVLLCGVQVLGGSPLLLGGGLPVGKGVLDASQVFVAVADLFQLQGDFLQFVQLAVGLAEGLFAGFGGQFGVVQVGFGRFRLCFQRGERLGGFLMLVIEGQLLLQQGELLLQILHFGLGGLGLFQPGKGGGLVLLGLFQPGGQCLQLATCLRFGGRGAIGPVGQRLHLLQGGLTAAERLFPLLHFRRFGLQLRQLGPLCFQALPGALCGFGLFLQPGGALKGLLCLCQRRFQPGQLGLVLFQQGGQSGLHLGQQGGSVRTFQLDNACFLRGGLWAVHLPEPLQHEEILGFTGLSGVAGGRLQGVGQVLVLLGGEHLPQNVLPFVRGGVQQLHKFALGNHAHLLELGTVNAQQFPHGGVHLAHALNRRFTGAGQQGVRLFLYGAAAPQFGPFVGGVPLQSVGFAPVYKFQLHKGLGIRGGKITAQMLHRAVWAAHLAVQGKADGVKQGGFSGAGVAGDEKQPLPVQLGQVQFHKVRKGAEGAQGQFGGLHSSIPPSLASSATACQASSLGGSPFTWV